MFVCDSFFFENSSVINLSGNPSNLGAVGIRSSMAWHAGSSGYGWPGVFVCALKDRYAPEPFLYNLVVAKTGEWTPIVKSYSNDPLYPWGSGDYRKHTPGNTDYISSPPPAASQANKNFASEGGTAIKVIRFIQADDFVPAPGVDLVPRSLAPGLAFQVAPNTPRTPGGDQSTITMTATANPSDSSYSYAKFEYRILGQSVWYPVSYKIKSEATITVASNGLSYEIKATAYGLDKRSGASTISTIAVGFVSQDPRYSSGGLPSAPEDIKVPAIKRLELINRLGNVADWDKFKSPDAEFKWAKTSVTAGGSIITTSGHRDLHLTGYKVRIFRTNGSILREEIVTDSYFIYSFEKNKKDTGGYPVREFKIDVQPVSSTGFTVKSTSITVSNPAPAAVSSPSAKQTKDGIDVSYTLPSDADFVGIRIRDKVYTGSSVTIDPSTVRDEVLTLTSVDQFGDGASVSVNAFNPAPVAVANVLWTQTRTGIDISYDLPNDVDFVGVKIRGILYTGSSVTITPSTIRNETLDLVSVDSLGDGAVYELPVPNPAPVAVANVSWTQTKTGIDISYDLPDDVDLKGIRVRGKVYTGSSITVAPSLFRNETIDLVSVDGIGDGSTYELPVTNPEPVAVTNVELIFSLEGISVSFTPPDDVDLIGVRIRNEVYTGSSVMLSPSTVRDEILTIVPVDGIGDGVAVTIGAPNDLPPPPTEILHEAGITSAKVSFVQPDDFDLLGTAYRYRVENGTYNEYKTAKSNEITLEGLTHGTRYQIELVSVDTLGLGNAVSIFLDTATIIASEIEGLGNWATAIDPVDSAFITANMEGESISGALIAAGGITNEKLGALAVDASKLAAGSVIAGKLGSLAVDAENLANGAVLTGKLGDLAVDAAKLADSAVTATKIANLAVGTAAIANAAITSAKIENLAVGTAAIANAAIDSAKIASLAVGTAAIQDLAVSDAKIGSLTASKITAGTLQATEYIQVGNTTDGGVLLTAGNGIDEGGYIQTIAPTVEGTSNYLMTMGPHIVGTDVYSLSASDGLTTPFFVSIDGSAKFGKLALSANGAISSDNFSISSTGAAEFTGSVTITGGSGIGSLTDAGALATADSVAYADTTGTKPPVDATNGAEWGSTLSGIPARISDTASTGLNLTATYLGYYDGTNFQSYIDSSGNFHFGQAANNYIDFTGDKLVIDTDNFGLDASGNASISGVITVQTGSNVTPYADVSTVSKIGCKINYSAFNTSNGGEVYYHGFLSDASAADINPLIVVDGIPTFIDKGRLNTNLATGVAYVVYESTLAQKYMSCVRSGGVWTKYYEGTKTENYSILGTEIVIGLVDQRDTEVVLNAVVWGYGVSMESLPDTLSDTTEAALNTGTTTMGAGTLHLEGTDANIAIGDSTTFGTKGIQLQYNEIDSFGKPQFYAGNGSNDYVKYTNDNGLEVSGKITVLPGSNIEIYDLLNYQNNWVAGTNGTQGIFSQNGSTNENRVVVNEGPWIAKETVWEMYPETDNSSDGGWNVTLDIDHNKSYVHGVYVKTEVNTGTTYLGCSGASTLNLNGTTNTNPYHWNGDLPTNSEWYLIIGVIQSSAGSVSTGLSGVYSLATGKRVLPGDDFKNKATALNQQQRHYNYYNEMNGSTLAQTSTRPFFMELSKFGDVANWTKSNSNNDNTKGALEASTTMGAGTLHLNGSSANIAIGAATTWASNGIQLQYNSGTPRAHIGSATNYVQYNGSKVIVETDNFSIDSSGNATFSGGGSFTGVVTVQSGSNVAIGADKTQDALEASTTMGAGTLHLNGSNANIAIGAATTWQSSGIQLQYNQGSPRVFIGSTVDKSLQLSNDELVIGDRVELVGVNGYNNNGVKLDYIDPYLITTYFRDATSSFSTPSSSDPRVFSLSGTNRYGLISNHGAIDGGSYFGAGSLKFSFDAFLSIPLGSHLDSRIEFGFGQMRLDTTGSSNQRISFKFNPTPGRTSAGRTTVTPIFRSVTGAEISGPSHDVIFSSPSFEMIYTKEDVIEDSTIKYYLTDSFYGTTLLFTITNPDISNYFGGGCGVIIDRIDGNTYPAMGVRLNGFKLTGKGI